MKESAVGRVGIIVLLVVVVACIAFIIYWVGASGPPETPGGVATIPPEEMACIAPGCGWTGMLTEEEMDKMETKHTPMRCIDFYMIG